MQEPNLRILALYKALDRLEAKWRELSAYINQVPNEKRTELETLQAAMIVRQNQVLKLQTKILQEKYRLVSPGSNSKN